MEADHKGSPGTPRTIKASEFKAKCLKLMDEVAETGEEIVITKHGRPVSKLVPCRKKPTSWFGRDRDIIRIHGDIVAPIDVEWEATTDKGLDLDP
ncbi:type II toxin-antitoxin system Phd/YefM family antitoxin [Candidatus Palauibacter sp.]|uniref:type II toxin-antitoxin system Phd/YefM family antitoxin n=1 Tax=Candidatus Palauibacter sp. TaxID=3101350 RepID=UPI003B017A1A